MISIPICFSDYQFYHFISQALFKKIKASKIVFNLTIATFNLIEGKFLEIDLSPFSVFSQLATGLHCLFLTALALIAPLLASLPHPCPQTTSFAALPTGFSQFWGWWPPLCLIPPQLRTPTCHPGLVAPAWLYFAIGALTMSLWLLSMDSYLVQIHIQLLHYSLCQHYC